MTNRINSWNALDPSSTHPMQAFCQEQPTVEQAAEQKQEMVQSTNESITIKNSCDIRVVSTDTKVAVSLQAALQVAIALVIRISILDGDEADRVTQELLQSSQISQSTRKSVVIDNSRNVTVTATDTDVAVSIQLLLQILVALLISLEIL
ncbi:spore coat protein [Heyndrickxia acidicola]|uniref:Spore coat protein n=1 Tax=Heyndrickxia acidicola TaxID=209389 RepID=A0ABU6MNB1_9BACI|nr:spore coat protein [Heyndrickxia acidicola]MED1204692.1 spore coat protein [Heyndrickxia acidicola]